MKLKELEDMRDRVQAVVNMAGAALDAYHSITVFSVLQATVAKSTVAGGSKEAGGEGGKGLVADEYKLRSLLRSTVPQMLPLLLSLLRCPLVSDRAFLCVLGQCCAVEDELLVTGNELFTLALALTLVLSFSYFLFSLSPMSPYFSSFFLQFFVFSSFLPFFFLLFNLTGTRVSADSLTVTATVTTTAMTT